MRFTHLAEFSEYAKYQPFKFYLLIFVIACFPVTYACGQAYIRDRRAGQQGFNGIRCENARAYRHQDNQNIREGFGQDRFRRNERDEKQIRGLIRTGKQSDHT